MFGMQRTTRCRSRPSLRPLSVEVLEDRQLLAFDPTGAEQELMQLINRFRTDPQHEFSRLMVSASPRQARDANVNYSLNYFNSDMTIVQSELAALTPIAPVAWDATTYQLAKDYLPFMIAAKSDSHTLDGTYQQRVTRYGYDFSQGGSARENLFINAFSPVHAHAAYVLEWGSGPSGLRDRGHRNNLMNTNVKFAGVAFAGVTYEPAIGFGPQVNAQELIGLGVTKPMITGALFQDQNGSGWYDAGEGLSGALIAFDGPNGHFSTSVLSAGGYSIEVPAGTYTATVTGGSLRFPIQIPNVQLSTQNVWLNFLYDPTYVPADARETNNSIAAATMLSGADQTLSDGTIHRNDIDYFQFVSTTAGTFKAELRFANGNGNLDLKLVDASGNILARSNGTTDIESASTALKVGQVVYVVIEAAVVGGTGGLYTLLIAAPPAQGPSTGSDVATMSLDALMIEVDVLANDRDPDGEIRQATVALVSSGQGTAQVTSDRKIRYSPPANYTGIDRLTYRVTDQQGLVSNETSLQIMVLDFRRAQPFLNPRRSLDVNDDGFATALDVLYVINEINHFGAASLPTTSAGASELFGFVDTNGNGSLEALDALLVINGLNTGASGESPVAGEGERLPVNYEFPFAFDLDWLADSAAKRRRQ